MPPGIGYSGNNQQMFPQNPFSSAGGTTFSPQQNPQNGLAGLLAPQYANGPTADTSPGRLTSTERAAERYGSTPQEVARYGPSPVLPFVGGSVVDIINAMQGTQGQYQAAALPLLAAILGGEQSLLGTYNEFFQPEVALRQELLNVLSGQNNDSLEALLGLQDQIRKPQSSTTYFAGF